MHYLLGLLLFIGTPVLLLWLLVQLLLAFN